MGIKRKGIERIKTLLLQTFETSKINLSRLEKTQILTIWFFNLYRNITFYKRLINFSVNHNYYKYLIF